jgi:trehalose/maltose hydrolase-like predicted phosphorylase
LDKDEFREAIDKGVLQNELAKKVLETKNEIIDKINKKILPDKMLIDLTLEKY